MPDVTSSLDVTVQSTESLTAGLDVFIADLSAALDVSISSTTELLQATEVVSAASPQIGAQLDFWISIGGAASQLFQLDTSVTTPLIVGDHVVSDAIASETFTLVNLDDDVVSIQTGPNALGILTLSGFVNNGDGTGAFTATFDTSIAVRELTVVAVDDVDNESSESPIHLVNSLEQAKLNDTFDIQPQSLVSTPTCNNLIDSVPDSNFTLKRQYTVAYSFDPTIFELRTITPNAPVEIVIVRRGLAGEPDETQRYVVIPSTATFLVSLRLGRGTNVITAFDPYGRADTAIVAATTYAAVLCSYAREIYNNSTVSVSEQETAIFSPVSTRLAEPFITFSDLLPDVRSQQTLAAKLAIRSLVNNPGQQIGVRDMLAALTLSTPIFVPQLPDDQYFEPKTRPLFNNQEAFAGVEAHVWLANACVQRWLAFIQYISNVAAFDLISISETDVIFRDENGDTQRHVFDFTAEECSLTQLALQALCFETIDVNVTIVSNTFVPLCAATYPFDLRPTPTYPIYPIGGEFGGELALDPGFDGYSSVSLTSHWDSGNLLDSQGASVASSSGIPDCAYDQGYLTTPLLLASVNATIDAEPSIAVTTSVDLARGCELDILLAANDIELRATLDINVRDTALIVKSITSSYDVAITGTQQTIADLDVLISA